MGNVQRRITIGILASAIALIAFVVWFKVSHPNDLSDQRGLLGYLPNEPNAVLGADFATLRRAGLLAASSGPLEPEYRAFLDGTGFDYRRDLDLLVASFGPKGNYFIARGRFDWSKLRNYAAKQGGSCYDQLCRAPGSTPERHISFLRLRNDVIALAVSSDDLAATRLTKQSQSVVAPLPNTPVWMSIAGSALNRPGSLPEGLRVSLSGLMDTDRVLLTAGPGPHGIEAHLEATCRTIDAARILESQLRSAAAILKDAISQNKAKSDETLAGLLSRGSFDREATKVTGRWRIDPALISGLTDGI
jgi:hypothetical protein